MGDMVKLSGDILKFLSEFGEHGVINTEGDRLSLQGFWNQPEFPWQ